jgi:hypothetical protein
VLTQSSSCVVCHCAYATCIHASHLYSVLNVMIRRHRRKQPLCQFQFPNDETTLVRAARAHKPQPSSSFATKWGCDELDGSERQTMVTQSVNHHAAFGSEAKCNSPGAGNTLFVPRESYQSRMISASGVSRQATNCSRSARRRVLSTATCSGSRFTTVRLPVTGRAAAPTALNKLRLWLSRLGE